MSALARFKYASAPLVDVDKFAAEGFVVAKRVLDVGCLESLLSEMDELFVTALAAQGLAATLGGSREALHNNAQRLLAADISAYVGTVGASRALPTAYELMTSDALLELVIELGFDDPVLSRPIAPHLASSALRIPGGSNRSPIRQAHADEGAPQVMAWAPLTPITVRAHPLEVMPRSHLFGPLPTARVGGMTSLNDPRIEEEMFAPLAMQPGDVVLFSPLLVHRMSDKGDGNLRVAFSGGFSEAAGSSFASAGAAIV